MVAVSDGFAAVASLLLDAGAAIDAPDVVSRVSSSIFPLSLLLSPPLSLHLSLSVSLLLSLPLSKLLSLSLS